MIVFLPEDRKCYKLGEIPVREALAGRIYREQRPEEAPNPQGWNANCQTHDLPPGLAGARFDHNGKEYIVLDIKVRVGCGNVSRMMTRSGVHTTHVQSVQPLYTITNQTPPTRRAARSFQFSRSRCSRARPSSSMCVLNSLSQSQLPAACRPTQASRA